MKAAPVRSNSPAILFGLAGCLLLLGALELSCFFLNRSPLADVFAANNVKGLPAREESQPVRRRLAIPVFRHGPPLAEAAGPADKVRRPDLLDESGKTDPDFWLPGGKMRPNSGSRSLVKVRGSGEVIYDVQVHSDSTGWRLVPQAGKGRKRHLLFLGCSLVLGEGVDDSETLPAVVAAHAPGFRAYNRGLAGSSIAGSLAAMQQGMIWDGVREPQGAAVYLFIDDHINRALGAMSVLGAWGGPLPYLREDHPGHFAFAGSFQAARPWLVRLYRALLSLETTRFFHLNLPYRLTRDHFARFARMIAQAKAEYQARFPGQRFYVVFHPGGLSTYAPQLIPELEQAGIPYLDYSGIQLSAYSAKPTTFRFDGHPTAESYRLLGEALAADLAAVEAQEEGQHGDAGMRNGAKPGNERRSARGQKGSHEKRAGIESSAGGKTTPPRRTPYSRFSPPKRRARS